MNSSVTQVNSKDSRRVDRADDAVPGGWVEPGQRPEFDEFTIVLAGMVRVKHEGGVMDVRAGQAVVTRKGEWVQYSTPEDGGAQYFAVCVPAFSPGTVHRDE